MSFIILSSVSLSKCYLYIHHPPVLCPGQATVGSGQSSAAWQHVPGLTMPGVFLASGMVELIPELVLVVLCVSSRGPGEFTLGKLGTSEAALTIVKQKVAQCRTEKGRQGMACQLERQRCETGRPSHPYLVLLVSGLNTAASAHFRVEKEMGELSQCPCGGDPSMEGGGEQFLWVSARS